MRAKLFNERFQMISKQIDDLELLVALGTTYQDLSKLFEVEPKEQGPERNEWLEFVAGQSQKFVIELANKTKERLANERALRKHETQTRPPLAEQH